MASLKMSPQAAEEIRNLAPRSFQELMAAALTIIIWVFAILVYLQFKEIPEWLLGLITFSGGVWMKSPSGS